MPKLPINIKLLKQQVKMSGKTEIILGTLKSLLIKAGFLYFGYWLCSQTIKLPNWRWMEQKLDPNFGMFETGLPLFRP